MNPPRLGEVLSVGYGSAGGLRRALEESLHGVPVPCQECEGQGTRHRNRDMFPCPSCHGTGQESRGCDGCGGSGHMVPASPYAEPFHDDGPCPKCGGSGRLPVLQGGLVERVWQRIAKDDDRTYTAKSNIDQEWVEALRQELEET